MPPPDATPEEIGEFWDTHDLADYWDETCEVEVKVNLKPRKRGNKMRDTIRFGDFVEVNPRIRLEKGKEYPYVEMADVTPGNAFVYPMKKRAYKGGGSRFQAGDTLFARITPCLENGKIVRSKHTKNEPCFGSTEFFIFRGKPNVSDSTYIFYLALSSVIRDPAVKSMTGASGRQRAILSSVEDIRIPAYSLAMQRKIAAVLSAYDDLIENNTRRIKILEDMAQTLYREWFVHFRFPGHENVPMIESPLGPIPQGWEIGEFGDIVENVREKVKPGKHLDHLPYVPIDCIPRRSISLMEYKPPSEAKSSLIAFKRNDILFGAMRSYFHKVIFAPFDGITRQTCFVFRSKNLNNYPFDLFTAFQDSTVQYSSNHSTGSTIPYATWDNALAMMPFFRPPDLLIKRFSDVVIPMLDSIQMMLKKNDNLRQTRDHLLPKLISGEIDVSELDININGIQPTKGGTYIPYPLTERLHSDGKILGGKPVIKGTRLAVAFILGLLKQGWSEKDIVENYPSVVHEDIAACRAYQEKVK